MAIRLYLESFRLPGEAQKINRIMESFGKHYHEQCPNLFKNADAVYILGYSVILLNTDQHNVGVSWSPQDYLLSPERHLHKHCPPISTPSHGEYPCISHTHHLHVCMSPAWI